MLWRVAADVVLVLHLAFVGFRCPLTPLEKWLRREAGSTGYDEGFVEHYIVPVLYPGEFTTTVKLVLAAVVAGANVLAYRVLWVRSRRAG